MGLGGASPGTAHVRASVFIIPGSFVKNWDDGSWCSTASPKALWRGQRGQHATHGFTFRGKPMTRMLNKGWLHARDMADLH